MPRNHHEIGSPDHTDDVAGPPRINSLWIGGPLSTMERLSMLSHLRQGHEYHLWVYDETNPPDGVTLKDATAICPRSDIFSYQVGQGKGSVSAFSNLFRYRLLLQQGGWWCDTDVVALKPFTFESEYVFASQVNQDDSSSTASCVIKVPHDSAVMRACHTRAMAADRSTLKWGVIGPRLLAEMVSQCDLERFVTSPETFCPTHWFDAAVDPAMHTWSLGKGSYAVHLWHELWRRNNLDKDASYPGTLYEALKAPYARELDTRPLLRRWVARFRGAATRSQHGHSPAGAPQRSLEVHTPGTPIADWRDGQLETSATRHAYGDVQGPLLTREPEGLLVFTPRTPDDHIAMPFVPLEPTAGRRALTLVLEGSAPGRRGCTADLQDQDYNVLTALRCDDTGEHRKTVSVSSRVTKVRVVFQMSHPVPVCLPARVRILDHIEQAAGAVGRE